ncbi:MAG: hypothetical protein PHN84_06635 [Desulfuromonadaceae bacterium]|nr:hypothetical protein [Desulfuromonadaceae bacterium]MDD2856179.1 hypothetical protein [Desulfuromonadaceae bacterium]
MKILLKYFVAALFVVIQYSGIASAGTLDEYYLKQFGEIKNTQLQKTVSGETPLSEDSPKCGTPLKKALRRDWNLLEESTQKVLAKQLAYPVISGEQTYTSTSGRFRIHYTLTGTDAVPNFAWVQTVADTFDQVAANYSALQWQLAPTNNNQPYDIYLKNLAAQAYYGMTDSDRSVTTAYPNSFSSWMQIDNNFTDDIYKPRIYPPIQSLQITAAHEYHHAIQYGYNYYFDIWYAEATSTWMEDELYDQVNQLYNYVTNWFTQSKLSLDTPVDTSTGGGYGRWIFNRYLSEKHTAAMIRAVWEKLGPMYSPNGYSDIPMTPVLESLLSSKYGTTLGSDFFDFSKRVYTREWASHTDEIDQIHPYSPITTYTSYPVKNTNVTLPGYSFAYYKFTPQTNSYLTITLSKTIGIKTTMFKNGVEMAPDLNGASYTANGLTNSDELVLLIANTTDLDGHSANFSTDGLVDPVDEPTTITTALSSSGSGSGCFIATAAYGSYLHPQVHLLREFRDDYLLTNASGRAFVKTYYSLSPPLADFISRHTVLRFIARLALTPVVAAVAHPAAAFVGLMFLVGGLICRLSRSKIFESGFSTKQF